MCGLSVSRAKRRSRAFIAPDGISPAIRPLIGRPRRGIPDRRADGGLQHWRHETPRLARPGAAAPAAHPRTAARHRGRVAGPLPGRCRGDGSRGGRRCTAAGATAMSVHGGDAADGGADMMVGARRRQHASALIRGPPERCHRWRRGEALAGRQVSAGHCFDRCCTSAPRGEPSENRCPPGRRADPRCRRRGGSES
jgi:hypothetical protein